MLRIDNISKSYSGFSALKDINIEIEEGSIFGLMGENGAGKTTLMKITSGLLMPDKGNIYFYDENIYANINSYQKNIGYMPDFFGVYDNIKVIEYMLFFAGIYGIYDKKADKRCIELLELFGMKDIMQEYVDTLSKGMKQKLCLLRSVIHSPKLLILDEPCSGMDTSSRIMVKQFLSELAMDGTSVIISSHIITDLSDLCTSIGVLDQNQMVINGSMDEIMKSINEKDPIYINICEEKQRAIKILKENRFVNSISIDDMLLMINFNGTKNDEADLLTSLIKSGVKIQSFDRKKGNLEKVFLHIKDNA